MKKLMMTSLFALVFVFSSSAFSETQDSNASSQVDFVRISGQVVELLTNEDQNQNIITLRLRQRDGNITEAPIVISKSSQMLLTLAQTAYLSNEIVSVSLFKTIVDLGNAGRVSGFKVNSIHMTKFREM